MVHSSLKNIVIPSLLPGHPAVKQKTILTTMLILRHLPAFRESSIVYSIGESNSMPKYGQIFPNLYNMI